MKGKVKLKKDYFLLFVQLLYDTYNGPHFPFWQHTTEQSFVFMSLPLGMHENNPITTLKAVQPVCDTVVHFHLLTWADLL